MDTVNKRLGGVFLVFLGTDKGCYTLVGEQHKLLDKPIRLFCLLEINAEGLAVFVDFKLDFGTFKRDRTIAETLVAENLGEVPTFENLFRKVALAGFDHSLSLFVAETAVGIDDSLAEPLFLNICVLVKFKNCRKTEFVLIGAKAAKIVAQSLGKHRHNTVDKVYRSGAFQGFLIQ